MKDKMHSSEHRGLIIFIAANALLLLSVIAFLALASFFPALFSCRFFESTGFYCPSCGGSRALRALISLDLIRSFLYYPPLLIILGVIIYIDLKAVISLIKRRKFPSFGKGWRVLIIPAVIILNFIIRFILQLSGIDVLTLIDLM